MSPRARLALGVVCLGLALVIVALAGSRRRPTATRDRRTSTLLAYPTGAKALYQALGLLRVDVRRLRRSIAVAPDSQWGERAALVILRPIIPLSVPEIREASRLQRDQSVGLVIAGENLGSLMRCYGLRRRPLPDSMRVMAGADSGVAVGAFLKWQGDSADRDTTRSEAVASDSGSKASEGPCPVAAIERADTLLRLGDGRPVAIRVTPDRGAAVIVIADAAILQNRALRNGNLGPVALGWFADSYRRVWFDEFHQGFSTGGSMASAAFDWSRRSPLGRLLWHLALVGLLALGFSTIRFGPVVEAIDRRRRSTMEHAQALALALRANGGHRAAMSFLVDGVRRRLTPARVRSRETWTDWLERARATSSSGQVREIADRLIALDRGQPTEKDVLETATLAEDLWKEMHR